MIYTEPNFVDKDICNKLCTYFDSHPEQLRKKESLAQQKFYGKNIDPYNINTPELKREIEILRTKATVKISKLYDTTVYLDYWDFCVWPPGDSMEMHADNVDANRKPFNYCGWRTHSAILYLNQNFGGGETVFRDQYSKIYPETGKLLMFPAGYDYTHGVLPTRDANRYTIALWFTEDSKHCMY